MDPSMIRAIAARKRILAQQGTRGPVAPINAAPAAEAAAAPALPPAVRRTSASGIRSGASEVPMDYATLPQAVQPLLPRISGQLRPENVASYPGPTRVATVPVERRALPPVQTPPTDLRDQYAVADPASPAIRNRDIASMTLVELDWFLDNGDPTRDEMRRMSTRLDLLQEQAEVRTIVTGAR